MVSFVVEQRVRAIAERDEQIDLAVVVVIDPADLPALADEIDAHPAPDLGEVLAVAIVAIQLVRHRGVPREPDVQIHVPVAVEIAPRRRARILAVGEADLRRDIEELAVSGIPIKSIQMAATEAHEQIGIAVVVEIGPGVGLRAAFVEHLRIDNLELRFVCRSRGRRFAQRLQDQAILRVRLDGFSAEREREVLAFTPVRCEVGVMRARRLRCIAGYAQPLRGVPVLDVEHEHERRARRLFAARG